MRKRSLAIIGLMVCSLLVYAHEFWMQPVKFFYEPGDDLVVNFKVGEDFIGEGWNVKKDRFLKMELHRLNEIRNLKDFIIEGPKDNLQVKLESPGTTLLVMQTNHASSELEAEKFNEYLKEDALDEVYAHRQKTNTLDKIGKEKYARYAKLLVQVGNKTDDTYKKVAGLPIEIVPEQNPYSLKRGDRISFKILFHGKPLFGAKVRIFNRYNNRTAVQNIFTQQDGVIETHVSNPGAWMVSVVKMIPSKDSDADWESFWGSLVFGVK